tara:strand:+ start:120 stop:818 length:699 start_codon:yes stop_codon:yes gene_type:complete
MKLSIIIPVFNEVNTIEKIINKIHLQSIKNFEIIIVDDCSTDGTREILKSKIRPKVKKIIYHKNNRGKGSAIITAKNYIKGDIVIIQDADLEYDPKDYKKLIFPILKKKTRVVYGTRVKKNKRYNSKNFISLSRIFFNHVLTIFSNFLNNQNLTDAHTCYKTFESKLFKRIKLEEEDFAFCPEVTSKISKLNEKILEVPINYKGRSKAQGKKIGLIDGFRAIYVIIKYRLKT